MRNETPPPCPDCRGTLSYRDRKPRIMKNEGGEKQWLMIRRFRCRRCKKLHNELPDCLVAFKHYKAEIISGIADGIVTPDDLDSENYPCAGTIYLWLRWFQINLERMEGYLRAAAYELSDFDLKIPFSKVSLATIVVQDFVRTPFGVLLVYNIQMRTSALTSLKR